MTTKMNITFDQLEMIVNCYITKYVLNHPKSNLHSLFIAMVLVLYVSKQSKT